MDNENPILIPNGEFLYLSSVIGNKVNFLKKTLLPSNCQIVRLDNGDYFFLEKNNHCLYRASINSEGELIYKGLTQLRKEWNIVSVFKIQSKLLFSCKTDDLSKIILNFDPDFNLFEWISLDHLYPSIKENNTRFHKASFYYSGTYEDNHSWNIASARR
jgi:hypothetical protein